MSNNQGKFSNRWHKKETGTIRRTLSLLISFYFSKIALTVMPDSMEN